jgi:hypothetical protein
MTQERGMSLMNPELQKDYEQVLAQVLRLDKSDQMNLIADLTARIGQGSEPVFGGRQPRSPKMADILAKAHESLAGLDQDRYWAEREQELTVSRASWAATENGSWRG